MNMKAIATLVFLGINAWQDWKKKQIFLWSVGIYIVGGIIFAILHNRAWQEFILADMMGIVLLLFSMGTENSLGLGDVWVIFALGCMLENELYILTLLLALLFSAFFSAGMLILKKAGKETEIPFVPFLLLGYLGGFMLC